MNSTPSRLLTRLDAEIAAQRDPLRADCLRAERAAYLVRQGYADEAKAELGALHQRHDGRPNVEMSAWMNLVESLLSFFSDMGPVALDKMRRARALSEAAGLTQLHALSAAWLAQMDYIRLDLPAMATHLRDSLGLALPENHDARARASLVVAQAYHIAERLDLALPWYSRVREHAAANGDDATISALMHNMASIRYANIRNAAFTGMREHSEGEHALLAAESTWTFDQLAGVKGQGSYVPLLHAQILSLEGRYSEALSLYAEHLQSAMSQGIQRLRGNLLADQAWCRLQLGQRAAALEDASAAEDSLAGDGSFDDRAPGFSRLAQVFSALGDQVAAERNERSATEMWLGHSKTQENLLSSLRSVVGAHSTP